MTPIFAATCCNSDAFTSLAGAGLDALGLRFCTSGDDGSNEGSSWVAAEPLFRVEVDSERFVPLPVACPALLKRLIPLLVSLSPVCVEAVAMDDLLMLDSLPGGAFERREGPSAIAMLLLGQLNLEI